MNDFTKEELQNMYDDLLYDPGRIHVGAGLLDKLKSMIDNYCEHEDEI